MQVGGYVHVNCSLIAFHTVCSLCFTCTSRNVVGGKGGCALKVVLKKLLWQAVAAGAFCTPHARLDLRLPVRMPTLGSQSTKRWAGSVCSADFILQ